MLTAAVIRAYRNVPNMSIAGYTGALVVHSTASNYYRKAETFFGDEPEGSKYIQVTPDTDNFCNNFHAGSDHIGNNYSKQWLLPFFGGHLICFLDTTDVEDVKLVIARLHEPGEWLPVCELSLMTPEGAPLLPYGEGWDFVVTCNTNEVTWSFPAAEYEFNYMKFVLYFGTTDSHSTGEYTILRADLNWNPIDDEYYISLTQDTPILGTLEESNSPTTATRVQLGGDEDYMVDGYNAAIPRLEIFQSPLPCRYEYCNAVSPQPSGAMYCTGPQPVLVGPAYAQQFVPSEVYMRGFEPETGQSNQRVWPYTANYCSGTEHVRYTVLGPATVSVVLTPRHLISTCFFGGNGWQLTEIITGNSVVFAPWSVDLTHTAGECTQYDGAFVLDWKELEPTAGDGYGYNNALIRNGHKRLIGGGWYADMIRSIPVAVGDPVYRIGEPHSWTTLIKPSDIHEVYLGAGDLHQWKLHEQHAVAWQVLQQITPGAQFFPY